jgi:predicted ATP-grasp superfamily ATP-dependent carboligase
VPINPENHLRNINKFSQYQFCEKNRIPCPQTILLDKNSDFDKLQFPKFPIIIKPVKHQIKKVFRSLYIENLACLEKHKSFLTEKIKSGETYLASDFIPGDDTNLFSFSCYRSKEGKILNEWSGKKLNQDDGKSGSFSSASNEAPEIIEEQGRTLVEAMDLMGISEVEFKYDQRDGTYKFIEINLRPTSWNRIGHLSGVNLHHTLYLDALGLHVPKQMQNKSKIIHLIYMKQELLNLLKSRGYWQYFKHNVFGARKRSFAIFNVNDPMPFFLEICILIKNIIIKFLKIFD